MARSIVPLILLAVVLTACAKSMSPGAHPGGSAVTPARATTDGSSGAPVLGTAAAGAAAGAGSGLSTKAPANAPNQPIWEK